MKADTLIAIYKNRIAGQKPVEVTLRVDPLLDIALGVCNEVTALLQDGCDGAEIDRRLGFVQGVMWATGLLNRFDVKAHNVPDGLTT